MWPELFKVNGILAAWLRQRKLALPIFVAKHSARFGFKRRKIGARHSNEEFPCETAVTIKDETTNCHEIFPGDVETVASVQVFRDCAIRGANDRGRIAQQQKFARPHAEHAHRDGEPVDLGQ
jgi:hypothetical protein